MTERRQFIAQLGVVAAALAVDADELRAASLPTHGSSPWDTSWIEKVAGAQYRVVFNGNDIGDGAVRDFVSSFMGDFHDLHGTTDVQTRAVVVFRRLGTEMGFNDTMWDKYAIGADRKINDPVTKAAARRNVFWHSASGSEISIE